jgi:hypothetical protein
MPYPEYIPNFVNLNFFEADFFELRGKPSGARRLTERRGGNARKFHLPCADLRLPFAKRGNGCTDIRKGG